MNRRQRTLTVIALAMICGTALLLGAVPQRLGRPGVKTAAIPDSVRLDIPLPERILDFPSTNTAPDAITLQMLPTDTSFGGRVYFKPGGIPYFASVVLMGTDRTSIHKAEYCLQGQGLRIDLATRDTVRLARPVGYDLPIIKILATDTQSVAGTNVTKKCVYVYWYVADGAISNDRSGFGRMWSMSKNLLLTGVLQRWAYVRFYAFCDPGQEDATYETIKHFIAASVPEFQTTPGPTSATIASQ